MPVLNTKAPPKSCPWDHIPGVGCGGCKWLTKPSSSYDCADCVFDPTPECEECLTCWKCDRPSNYAQKEIV